MTAELEGTVAAVLPEIDGRVAALRACMAARGLAAVALASPENIYYLTGLDHLGYFTFSLLVVPSHGQLIVVTREMERPTVRAQIPHCRHLTFGDGADAATVAAAALAEAVPPGRAVAVEEAAMFFPPGVHARVRAALPDREWADATPLLAQLRAVKSPVEVGLVRRAAAVSDAAMLAGIAAARPGAAEGEVAAAVYQAMFACGGCQPGFVPLIRPLWMLDREHVTWGDRALAEGTGLFLELSGCVERYHAPLARTVYVGRAPDGARESHAAALTGLLAAADALRPGVRTGEVYAAWQRAVAGAEFGAWPLRHHCGYLVGIGFPPSWVGGGEVLGIRPDGDVVVEPGMTFHLMSWVTGHVVSDTALVTTTGTELLTSVPRGLIVTE
jgi:Xaa-Pro dipeptidase